MRECKGETGGSGPAFWASWNIAKMHVHTRDSWNRRGLHFFLDLRHVDHLYPANDHYGLEDAGLGHGLALLCLQHQCNAWGRVAK